MPRTTTKKATSKKTNTKAAPAKKNAPVLKRKKVKAPKATYRTSNYKSLKFRSASAMVVYLLKKTKWPQVKIAKEAGVTAACVCQLAADYRE